MHGVLNIDKPAGITSHDVVNKIRRAMHIKRVGHAGTLDPMATGVLLVCVGRATRIVEFLMGAEKEYEGEMTLGLTTDSEDSSGTPEREEDASWVTREHIEQALPEFLGDILQIPPMVSAAHHEGKRLYQLAREGKVVDREPRQVRVMSIDLLSFRPGTRPSATLRVVCSKGVYIRTLFADIGQSIGVGAHMSALRRTRIGRFRVNEAMSVDTLADIAEHGGGGDALISMAEALNDIPQFDLSPEMAEDVMHGRAISAPESSALTNDSVVRLVQGTELIALAKVEVHGDTSVLQPDKVFA
jgi:tRNA pseudouridine55 synthase